MPFLEINVANDEELVETDQYKTAVMASAQGIFSK